MLITFLKKAKPCLPQALVSFLEFIYYRIWMKTLCLYLDRTERLENGVPGASLRYRVNGTPGLADFMAQGENCSEDLVRGLAKAGRSLASFDEVLDFGCGCARTLRWFARQGTECRFSGTDIDAEAIAFCRDSFSNMSFSVNGALPPLGYPAAKFDLIYCISVFTHLDEEYQFRWLAELRRVARPGAILLLSVHGENCWGKLPVQHVSRMTEHGFLFLAQDVWKGIFPQWYQTAFHSEEYVRRVFSRHFSVIDYLPKGISDFQDLVVLCNDLESAAPAPGDDAAIGRHNG